MFHGTRGGLVSSRQCLSVPPSHKDLAVARDVPHPPRGSSHRGPSGENRKGCAYWLWIILVKQRNSTKREIERSGTLLILWKGWVIDQRSHGMLIESVGLYLDISSNTIWERWEKEEKGREGCGERREREEGGGREQKQEKYRGKHFIVPEICFLSYHFKCKLSINQNKYNWMNVIYFKISTPAWNIYCYRQTIVYMMYSSFPKLTTKLLDLWWLQMSLVH